MHRRLISSALNKRFITMPFAAAILALVTQANAQQPAAPVAQAAPAPQAQPEQKPITPPPPPSWQQGRPDSMKSSTLAPNPPGMTARAASEMKLDKTGRAHRQNTA